VLDIRFSGFDWDEFNRTKIFAKHGIAQEDIEHALRNRLVLDEDKVHSIHEPRLLALGRDRLGRMLFVVFTLRFKENEVLARPISARRMHQRELMRHENI
jgi:uncharacterized DUF497 family protein